MALPREDWLAQAQRLAVGQKLRVRHGFERTAAMDVFNHEDRWSAYCHRCHESGTVFKEHQTVRRVVVEESRVAPVPTGTLHISQASAFDQRRIWAFLIEKGCPPGVIPEEYLWWAKSVQRLTLRYGNVGLGRALDSWRQPKWLPYGEWQGQPMVWWTRTGAGATVLVEDALSGYKVAKAIALYAPESSASVVATLGTTITDRFLPVVAGRPVACMYDGDPAGVRGLDGMRRRLRVWGSDVHDCRPAVGDPKNMSLEDIWEKLRGIV